MVFHQSLLIKTLVCSFFFHEPHFNCFGDHRKHFVTFQKKRYQRNISNFFILHLSVTELVYRLVVFPVVISVAVPGLVIKSAHCKLSSFLSETCRSAIFVSLVAIATDRYKHIMIPLQSLKSKRKPYFLVSLVWLYATVVSCVHVISFESISVSEIPQNQRPFSRGYYLA